MMSTSSRSSVLSIVMTMLLVVVNSMCCSAAEVSMQAFVGQPFGVGIVTQRRVADSSLKDWDAPYEISDTDGRVLYPVRLVAAISDAKPNQPNFEVWHYFLFRGEEPLTLKSVDGEPVGVTIAPVQDANNHAEALKQWWKARGERRQQLTYFNGASPLIAEFSNAMLARRLSLPHRQAPGGFYENDLFGFLLGTESIREAIQAARLLTTADAPVQIPDQPLPEGVGIPHVPVPPIPEGVVIESLAQHVPAECFYLRCGSYSNFVWLRQTIDQWGSNFRDTFSRKSIDYRIQQRCEQQLSLRETELTRLFGDTVIKDIALIGFDSFVREGAAVGLLLESDKPAVLRAAIIQQRSATKEANSEVTEQTVEIAGRRVEFLSSPDHRVRSFFATDGNVVLVTNSRELVRRFYEAGAGKDALASLDEFRYARSQHSLTEPSTAFLHLSDNFFRNLLSPKYRAEMTRRALADVEIENMELARLAARAEAVKIESVDDVFRLGFLPAAAAKRPDGSKVVLSNGRYIDSLRGARGFFIPVADMEITKLTLREVEAYAHFKRQYAQVWERVDPVTINITKQPIAERPGRERVVLQIRICPVARSRYGFVSNFFAPPQTKRLASIPGSLFELQARGKGPQFSAYCLFGAIDGEFPTEIKAGQIVRGGLEQELKPLFFVTDNRQLVNDFIRPGKFEDDRDYDTPQSWFGWLRQTRDFTVLAGAKELLGHVAPNLKFEEAERPAQLRLRVADLSAAKAFARIRADSYLNDARISVGTAVLLNDLTQEFRLAPNDGLDVAERVLNGRVTCMLGGELKHAPAPEDFAHWRSSKLTAGRMRSINAVPNDYRCRVLDWWHGLDLEFSITEQTLHVRAELEIQP